MKIPILKFAEGLRRLSDNLSRIEHIDFEASLIRSKIASGEIDFESALHTPEVLAWKQFHDDIVLELNAVVAIGQEQSIELPNCRKLSIALAQGYYDERSRLTLESIAELNSAFCKLKATKPKPSRQQPEHPITKWVRRYRSKYPSNAETVRAYLKTHEGKYATVLQDLKNDLRKKPLLKSKKTS